MSILNLGKTRDHIVSWIKDYAESAGSKALVVGLSGGIDSALVALLCKQTGLPVVCVAMPCHSSGFSLERARAFAEEQGLKLWTVDLTEANDSIFNRMPTLEGWNGLGLKDTDAHNPIAVGGLRSCLRAPTLSYFALATRGLIVGTGNRSEDNLIRYFQKYGDGCVDVSPIADLFKSEVYQLFADMTGLYTQLTTLASLRPEVSDRLINQENVNGPPASAAIYSAVPTADLWGEGGDQTDEDELGFSYDEVEWADRQNMLNGIVTEQRDPTTHRSWGGYTLRQREVLAKVSQMERASRHKHNPAMPVCKIRMVKGLVN